MKHIIISVLTVFIFAACGQSNYDKRVTEFRATPVYNGIAVMGDSNTELCGINCPECFNGLRANRGISGATAWDMANLARDVIIRERPRRIELMIGTNDLIGGTGLYTYSRMLIRTIRRIRDNLPGVPVYISSVLPTRLIHRGAIIEINTLIASIAGLYPEGVYFVDRYAEFDMPSDFNDDGVHLNRKGCMKMFKAGHP